MKYKRGSTVEVFCNQSWRCARIVSGKGNNYTVSYDVYPGFTNKDDVEQISAKFIRPCPPEINISECWEPGDVAEVFHNLSWKMAIVLEDSGLDQFIVRLVGCLQEFEVTKSELRVRQSYQDGQWIVIGKVPSDHKEANCHLMESHVVFSKTLKRASPCYNSQDETNKKRARKIRKYEKEGRQVRVQGKSPAKVDAVDNRKMHINRTSGYESSSGSCSINSYKQYEKHYGSGYLVEDIEDHESDAESVCQHGNHEESQSQETDESAANEAVADEIHRLELHAYRNTMAALHALGPLNWEKETMGLSTGLNTLLLHHSADVGENILKHIFLTDIFC